MYASLFIITYMYFNAKTVHGMTYTTSLSISCLLWVCKFFYVMNRPSDSHIITISKTAYSTWRWFDYSRKIWN